MKLRDLGIEVRTVELSVGPAEVRAVSTNDLMLLMGDHGPSLALAFGRLTATAKTKGRIDTKDVESLIAEVVVASPGFMSRLLSLLNDDPTEQGREVASKLPIPDQLLMLNAAAEMTLRSEAHVKKLVEALRPTAELIFGAMAAMPMKMTSRTGIGASVAKSRS